MQSRLQTKRIRKKSFGAVLSFKFKTHGLRSDSLQVAGPRLKSRMGELKRSVRNSRKMFRISFVWGGFEEGSLFCTKSVIRRACRCGTTLSSAWRADDNLRTVAGTPPTGRARRGKSCRFARWDRSIIKTKNCRQRRIHSHCLQSETGLPVFFIFFRWSRPWREGRRSDRLQACQKP